MAKWHRQKAKDLRALLLSILGNKCAKGPKGCKGSLTFDCIVPHGHDHHRKWDTYTRVMFYIRQAEKNNVRILCERHNARKGRNTDQEYHKKKDEPF